MVAIKGTQSTYVRFPDDSYVEFDNPADSVNNALLADIWGSKQSPFDDFIDDRGEQIATWVPYDGTLKGLTKSKDPEDVAQQQASRGVVWSKIRNKFMQELDDSKMQLKFSGIPKDGVYKLSDLVEHDVLFKYVPEIKNLKIYIGQDKLTGGDRARMFGLTKKVSYKKLKIRAPVEQKGKGIQLTAYLKELNPNFNEDDLGVYLDTAQISRKQGKFSENIQDSLIHEMQHLVDFLVETRSKFFIGSPETQYENKPLEQAAFSTQFRRKEDAVWRELNIPYWIDLATP